MKDTGIQGLTDRGQTGREPELAGVGGWGG